MYSTLEVNQAFGKLGDSIQYKITIKNENEPKYQVRFNANLPEELYFLKGEILDERDILLNEVMDSIFIGDLKEGEKKVILLDAEIRSFPSINPITYIVDVGYASHDKVNQVAMSNAVMTLVNDPNINVESGGLKVETNKQICDKKSIIDYTVKLKNQGNAKAEKLELEGVLPKEGRMLEETLVGEGCVPKYNQGMNRIEVEFLDIQQGGVIRYSVELTAEPKESDQSHQVRVTYGFTMANREKAVQRRLSKKIPLHIETAYFDGSGLVKTCSKQVATALDILQYELHLYNRGNVTALNVSSKEYLGEKVSFVEGSLKINQISCPDLTIDEAILLGDIKGNQKVILTYEVRVEEIRRDNDVIENQSEINYRYIVDEETIDVTLVSEKVYTSIEQAFLITAENREVCNVSPTHATIGEEIYYSIYLTNQGNVEARDISIKINKEEQGIDIQKGSIEIPILKPNDVIDEVFTVKVNGLLENDSILPEILCSYSYFVGGDVAKKEYKILGEKTLKVEAPIVEIKMEDQKEMLYSIALEEVVEIPLQVINKGNKVADISEVFVDVPDNLELLGMGKVLKDTKLQPGEIQELLLQIKSIGVGQKHDIEIRIDYDYTLENSKEYSKTISCFMGTVQVHDPGIFGFNRGIIAQVKEDEITLGEIIHYTLTVNVPGNREARNLKVILPEVSYGNWSQSIPLQRDLVLPDQQIIFCFDLELTDTTDNYQVKIQPKVQYEFVVGDNDVRERSVVSDELVTVIQVARISQLNSGIEVESNIEAVELEGNVTMRMLLTNTGNVQAETIFIKSIFEEDVKILENTLRINGQLKEYMIDEIFIDKINPSKSCEVVYQVKVNSMPKEEWINGIATIVYKYKLKEKEIHKIEEVKLPRVHVKDPDIQLQDYHLPSLCNRIYADIGEEIEYEACVKLRGNLPVQDIVFKIHTSENMMLIGNDIIHIKEIGIKESYTFKYKAKVVQLGSKEQVESYGSLKCSFINSEGIVVWQQQRTKNHITKIVTAGPKAKNDLLVEPATLPVRFGEVFDVVMTIANSGNRKMDKITIGFDAEEPFFELVEAFRDEYEQLTIQQGQIEVGSINQARNCSIYVKGRVIQLAEQYIQKLKGKVTYEYIVDENEAPRRVKQETEQIDIICKECGLSDSSQTQIGVNRLLAKIGDSLTYSIYLENKGNTAAKDIQLELVFSEGFEEKKHIINVLQLDINDTYTEEIQKVIKEIPQSGWILVKGIIRYTYEDYENIPRLYEREIGGCKTEVSSPYFSPKHFTKKVDKEEVTVGEIVQYDIYCENGGNAIAKNVALNLQLPQGLELIGDAKSLTAIGDLQPSEGITIHLQARVMDQVYRVAQEDKVCLNYDVVTAGAQETLTVYDVAPTKYMIKNPKVAVTLEASTGYTVVGSKVTYTLMVENMGNCEARLIKLLSCVPEEIQLDEAPELLAEILGIGERVSITLKGTVQKRHVTGISTHQAIIAYDFALRREPHKEQIASKVFELVVEESKLEVSQYLDKAISKIEVGKEVAITMKVVNVGTLKAKQMVFHQIDTPGLVFIGGSLKVNEQLLGVGKIENGVNIGQLLPNQNLTISFRMKVETYTQQMIACKNFIEYLYESPETGKLLKQTTDSGETQLAIISPYRDSYEYKVQYLLPYNMADIQVLNKTNVAFNLIQVETSYGEKVGMLVKGIVGYKVQYMDGMGENRLVEFKKIWMRTIERESAMQNLVPQVEVRLYDQSEELINPRELQIRVKIEVEQK